MRKLMATILVICILLAVFSISTTATTVSEDSAYAKFSLKVRMPYTLNCHHYASLEEIQYYLFVIRIRGCVTYTDISAEQQLEQNGYIDYVIVVSEFVDMEDAIAAFKARKDIIKLELLYPELSPQLNIDNIIPDYKHYGDVNDNDKIDARDYLLVKRAYFGTHSLVDESVADINGNGKLDARDYLLLKRAYFGTYTIGTPDATPDEA